MEAGRNFLETKYVDEAPDPLTVTPDRVLGFAFGFEPGEPALDLG